MKEKSLFLLWSTETPVNVNSTACLLTICIISSYVVNLGKIYILINDFNYISYGKNM